MRINECMTLRIKDIDFDLRSITVCAAKGNKDWAAVLPEALIPDLRSHLIKVAQLHQSALHCSALREWLCPDAKCFVQKISIGLKITGLAVCLPLHTGSPLA